MAKVGLYGLEDGKPFTEDSLETTGPSARGYED